VEFIAWRFVRGSAESDVLGGHLVQVERVEGEGYYGGVRLLMATCKVFHSYCSAHGIPLHGRNFTLSYDTNVPRQVSDGKSFLYFYFYF
jgi:hypothetical protein